MGSKEETAPVNPLPAELLGRSIQNLSVNDRLHCERVSPRWKWIVEKFGWIEEKKLNQEKVFEGTTEENSNCYFQRFYDPTGGNCNLLSLLYLIGPNLVVLDLASFEHDRLQEFAQKIAKSLQMMKKLEKLNMEGFDLADFVTFLPSNLRLIRINKEIKPKFFKILSEKCPNLEKVPFHCGIDLNYVRKFIGRFPRQTELDLSNFYISEDCDIFESIAQLKELKALKLYNLPYLDTKSFDAMANSCKRLRKLSCVYTYFTLEEALLSHLNKMSHLTVLEVRYVSITFTDSVLKTIANQGKLKVLLLRDSCFLTDDSIEFLIGRCKSLVSLDLYGCGQITERSLEAVIAEVHRRHGYPPQKFPNGLLDSGIFYFNCLQTKICKDWALKMKNGNPWLVLNDVDGREIV